MKKENLSFNFDSCKRANVFSYRLYADRVVVKTHSKISWLNNIWNGRLNAHQCDQMARFFLDVGPFKTNERKFGHSKKELTK